MITNPLDFLAKFSDAGLDFVIVGGVAVRLWGSSRLTHDIDLVPNATEATWAKVVQIVWDAGGRPRIPESLAALSDWRNVERWRTEKNLLAITFRSPDQTAEVDFLLDQSLNYDELRTRATKVTLGAHTYNVASIDDLIAMKLRAGRPQDLLDVEELRAIKLRQAG